MGRSCRDDTGYCENEGNYNCINSEPERVQCQSEGNFPDPYDCKKYFICVLKPDGEFDKYTRECSGSYVYDPFIKKCEKKVEKCASSVSICNSELESGPISGNLNIFYKCIRANVTVGYNYVPQMYDCPENFFYNGTSCVDREFTGLGDNKKCIEIGRFPSADSCYHYNTCGTIGGEPLVRACGVDYRFSPITKLCQKLDCGLCKW